MSLGCVAVSKHCGTEHQSSFGLCFCSVWPGDATLIKLVFVKSKKKSKTLSQPMHASSSTNMLSSTTFSHLSHDTHFRKHKHTAAAVMDHYTSNMKCLQGERRRPRDPEYFMVLISVFCTNWWTRLESCDISDAWFLQFLKIDWMWNFPTGSDMYIGLAMQFRSHK